MEESIKNKTVKGFGWSAIDNVAKIGVTFVVSIVLARLLTPDDYGLIGIIQIVTVICTALINAGFTTALIRKKDITDDDYNTSFIVNLCISLFLYLVVFFCSPIIGHFFGREELVSLIRVTSVGFIIGAFALVQQTRLTKIIDFRTQTKVTLFASLGSGIIGIVMALVGFGVWALVAQVVIMELIRTILLWYYNKWIPKFRFSFESFHDLFGFGWKIMISNLLDAIWKELYQVVVGKFYSPATLGQYTRSKQFSKLFSSNFTIVVQRVTYPVLSSIQDDCERLLDAYRRIIKTTMFITVISMFALAAIAEPLLYCLIGPKWHEAAVYLPLICVTGSMYPLHAINLNMLQLQGRSDLYLGLEIIKKIMYLGPLAIGALVGIMPMLYTNIGMTIVVFFLNSHYSGKLLGYSSWMQFKDVIPFYCYATLLSVPVFLLKFLPITYWFTLFIQLFVWTILFICMFNIVDNREYKEVKGIVEQYVRKFRE